MTLRDCYTGGKIYFNLGPDLVTFEGSNWFGGSMFYYAAGSASVTISSGAIIDLTGNSNTTPINPGGGVTFEPGGATIYPSAGSASAYTLGGMTVPQIGNTNVVNLNSSNVMISGGGTAYASGCTFSGGSAPNGGAYDVYGSASLHTVVLSGNSAYNGGGIQLRYGGVVSLFGCVVSGNHAAHGKDLLLNTGTAAISGCTIGDVGFVSGSLFVHGSNVIDSAHKEYSGSGAVVINSGAIVDLTGNANTTPINPGGGITISSGGITIIDSGGSEHEFQRLAITGNTINNLGQIYGATVYVPASSGSLGPWNIETTLGSSTVSAGEQAQEIVIEGGLVGIEEQ